MTELDLPGLFAGVAADLEGNREQLNQADEYNHNHGDHMVEIFRSAAQAAEQARGAGLAEAMNRAARLLLSMPENGSAQVYARGLAILADQLGQRGIELDDLVPYVANHLKEKQAGEEEGKNETELAQTNPEREGGATSGDILKALLAALSEWERVEAQAEDDSTAGKQAGKPGSTLDLGYLFGVGMAYMQAKQKGGDRLDVLSETVVSASPLSKLPHRRQSGFFAVRSFLEKLGQQSL